MKKFKLFAASLAALALAGCTSEDYLGDSVKRSNVIGFGTGLKAVTRADFVHGDAAEKLNNNFIVYGFKTNAAESSDQMVFNLYNVNYTSGTANTTESNTADWEYVGYANHDGSVASQTIKYWDYAQDKYVFSAVSGTGIEATKTTTGTSVYDKGWTIKIPAGGSIADLYASDRKVVEKADYQKQVDLTFRALGTKIRFAMYETVPGYEVHIDKFYYNSASWENTETNFAINGTFNTANAETVTPLTITYYDDASGIENRPKVTYDADAVTTAKYGVFGANIQATPAIGTNSAEATYDQSDKSYTMILPYESMLHSEENVLELYVDYTLTSTDGSGETIEVKHASAKVPTNFNQWKPNFAYTYLFKISDNTNGTTGNPGDPDDPTTPPTDPTGLFPITFDAVVVTDETDVQETITSVSDPSITTYQKGVVATANDEYVAGDNIYFENGTANVSGYKVYEVNNFGKEPTTEEVVANYLNNFCVLTEVETTDAAPAGIPLSNGTYIKKTANQAHYFMPEAGKTYVITDGAGHYKVVKVTGNKATATYTLSSDATITTANGYAVLTLKKDDVAVLGAAPCFKVTKDGVASKNLILAPGTTEGTYVVTIDGAAVANGTANGNYTVEFNDQRVTVTVNYANSLSALADVEAGDATGQSTTLTIAGLTSAPGAVIVNDPVANKGITITDNGDGTYTVKAAKNVAAGTYTATIAGITLNINVKNYRFNVSTVTMTKPYNDKAYANINLWDGSAAPAVDASDITGATTGLAVTNAHSSADGQFTLAGSKGGVYTLTYKETAAKCVVTVNEYTIATPASIKKSTGIANIEVKCNGTAINAATASLVETAKPDGAVYTVSTNGKTIKFSSASKAGAYKFNYKVGDVVVAQVTVTVTE